MLCYACGLTDRLAKLLENCSSEYSGLLLAAGGANSRLIVGNIDKNDGPRGSRARCGRGSAEVSQVLPRRVVGRPSGTTYRLKQHARVARQQNNALVPCPATVWGTHCDCEITTERAMGQRLRYGHSSSQSNLPLRYGNSHGIQDHTVLPATRQR